MNKYQFETLEEYRRHLRQNSKNWYEKNKEKKKAYQREYYAKKKLKEAENNLNNE